MSTVWLYSLVTTNQQPGLACDEGICIAPVRSRSRGHVIVLFFKNVNL